MDSLNRKAAFLPSISEKSKKVRNDPLDEIYDCIIVRMPSTHSAANGRSPLATLPSSSINSSNTVKPLNIFKSSHSTQTKLKFSALPVTQTPERKVKAPRSRNHRKNISPTVGKLKACAEQEVQLVSLHGEHLIGRRRSRRVAECPRVNYMEIPPISEEDNQLEELTSATTPRSTNTRSFTTTSYTSSSQYSTPKPTRHVQGKRNEQKPAHAMQGTQSADSSEASRPRARILRSSTYSSTGSNSSSSRSTSPTSTLRCNRRTTLESKVSEAHPADMYPSYLEQFLRDRIYDKQVTADKEMQVFEEEVRQRVWKVRG